MKHLVVLTGAGMSAESGIKTFRDADGLWEGHDVMEVASPGGFSRNPELVLDFYNQRRRQLLEVQPNSAHYTLAELEHNYKVSIVTQNVDDLHERAGSTNVLHLHGELFKVRSTYNETDIQEWKKDLVKANNDALYHGSMDDNSISADVVDQASSYTDKNVEMKAINRQIKLISEIDKALMRIKDEVAI